MTVSCSIMFYRVCLSSVALIFIFFFTYKIPAYYDEQHNVYLQLTPPKICSTVDTGVTLQSPPQSRSMLAILPATREQTKITNSSLNGLSPVKEKLSDDPQVAESTQAEDIDSEFEEILAKGILTRELYEAGHDIPNLQLCPDLGVSLKFLVLIISAPSNADARMAIRQTWGHYALRKDIQISFFLGRATTPEVTSMLDSESNLYGDIIMGRFMDSYKNLSLKTTSIMEWVDHYCPKVRFILKTDDDMFINIAKLIEFTEQRKNAERTIFGFLARHYRPFRDASNYYYVSIQQYAPKFWPDFMTGPAYLLTGDIVRELYVEALNLRYLKLEDVFFTGIIARRLKVTRISAKEFLNTNANVSECTLKQLISIVTAGHRRQYDLWKNHIDSQDMCVDGREDTENPSTES